MSLPKRDAVEMSLTVPGIVAARPLAIDFIVNVLRSVQVPLDVEHAVISAFGEAFNNIVLHSYRDGAGSIDIEVDTTRDRLRVRLFDSGDGFDPLKVRARGDDELPEGGLGLFIMMRTMDDVRWYRERGKNVVAMTKRIVR